MPQVLPSKATGFTKPLGSPANVLLVLFAIPEEAPVPEPYVAVAPETSPATRVPANGPLLAPAVSELKFHVANVLLGVHVDGGAGEELTTNVSEAVSSVSVVPIFNVLVVLL
jgi:hypothetical protein